MSNSNQDPPSQPGLKEAIDDILSQLRCGTQSTKRRHHRHAADGLILYITQNYETGKVPSPMNFFPVRCRNLSSSGFSFFFPVRPSFQSLIVQLGNQEQGICMESQVVHVDLVKDVPEQSFARDSDGQEHKIRLGSKTFEVGCQFLQRIPASN